ncbi:hypothetical protein M426DRAFT_162228 [Hypoxylon sp. CI-4A]|nr:hypothetical protein M426DRAFT_162228 [Hypoxylon sp. CI-4A]
MTRYAISSRSISVRSESPPPPYSEYPAFQPRSHEQTPLLNRKRKPKARTWHLPKAWRIPKTWHLPKTWHISFIFELFVYIIACVAIVACTCGAVFLLKHLWFVFTFEPPLPLYSVAIVGAGPAGISAAQHLHRNVGTNIRLNITLFESAPSIGGQLALNDSTGGQVFPYDDHAQDPITAEDITGSALLWGNPLFTRVSEVQLGDEVEFSELPSQDVSYFSGDNVVVQTTRPYGKIPTFSLRWLSLVWRYGQSAWCAGALVRDGTALRDHFMSSCLESNIMQLMISLGFLAPAQEPAHDGINARGISDQYVTEILGPDVQRTHAQKISDVSTLATMLAAAQEDSANAYAGGELIDRLEQIVGSIRANVLLSTRVSGIKHAQINEEKSAWLVKYDTPRSTSAHIEAFDRVIVAAPSFDLYQTNSIDDIEAASILAYRSTHVTFFTLPSRLDPNKFGDVNQVLFLENQNEDSPYRNIRELAFVREVIGFADDERRVEYLYRALSDSDVTEQLQSVFEITWRYQVKLENAYPYIFPIGRFPQFKLSQRGLWWTSVIHTVASTIDMSVLAGKIVAQDVLGDLK